MANPNRAAAILLVEDQDNVRGLCVEVLSQAGYQVTEARNGPEALAVMQDPKRTFDLLLTDVVMPGMTGTQLVQELRTTLPDLKVLFISGYSSYAANVDEDKTDETAFLIKPFSPTALLEKVSELLAA